MVDTSVDYLVFAIWPYAAVLTCVVFFIYRYLTDRFSFSSQSSQFVAASRSQSWGSVPWHYGVLVVLLIHLVGFSLPNQWGSALGQVTFLSVSEVTGWVITSFLIFGLVTLTARRALNPRVRVTTTVPDWILLFLLLTIVILGLFQAIVYAWGSLWFLNPVVPWLQSLLMFNPQVSGVTTLPLIPKIHIVLGFLLIAILPFTRLVHAVSAFRLFTYINRPYQVVIWYAKGAESGSASRRSTAKALWILFGLTIALWGVNLVSARNLLAFGLLITADFICLIAIAELYRLSADRRISAGSLQND